MFERIERPLSEILLWLESKKVFIAKIVPPSVSFTATSSSSSSSVSLSSSVRVDKSKVESKKGEKIEDDKRNGEEINGEERNEERKEERRVEDINSVTHLLNLIDRTRTTTEDIIIEREAEIARQITLKSMLLQQNALDADLRAVTDMQNNTHQTVRPVYTVFNFYLTTSTYDFFFYGKLLSFIFFVLFMIFKLVL